MADLKRFNISSYTPEKRQQIIVDVARRYYDEFTPVQTISRTIGTTNDWVKAVLQCYQEKNPVIAMMREIARSARWSYTNYARSAIPWALASDASYIECAAYFGVEARIVSRWIYVDPLLSDFHLLNITTERRNMVTRIYERYIGPLTLDALKKEPIAYLGFLKIVENHNKGQVSSKEIAQELNMDEKDVDYIITYLLVSPVAAGMEGN